MPEVEGGDVYPFHGVDGENNPIGPCDAFWKRVLTKKIRKDVDDENTKEGKLLWYHQGVQYWNHVDATVDGVLGGFGSVSGADAKENERILRTMMYPEEEFSEILEKRALDVGAGVGRVSSTFLTKFFRSVDLLEPVHHFIEKAKATLKDKVQNYFEESLEEFSFEEDGKALAGYDVIWIQWCIGQLSDADFIDLLKRAKVNADGFIVVKENNCSKGFHWDDQDSSITRSDNYFRWIFEQAGMEVVNSKVSDVFPKELFAVRTYVLKRSPPKKKSQ